jgi:hypothetical protein
LEDRLDADQQHAKYWWRGFVGFYGLGTVVTSVQAATENDGGDQAVHIVSAVKAAFGTARLLYAPPSALRGSDPLREVDLATQAACDRRVATGERLLRQNAKEAKRRHSWKQHLSVVGINAAGALIAGEGFGERKDASVSAAIGIGVGEVMTFLHPWRAAADLEEYEHQFAVASASEPNWRIYPMPRGAGVQFRF